MEKIFYQKNSEFSFKKVNVEVSDYRSINLIIFEKGKKQKTCYNYQLRHSFSCLLRIYLNKTVDLLKMRPIHTKCFFGISINSTITAQTR